MLLEGLLTSSVPASARLLGLTETATFASSNECESVTLDDVNERLKVRGWLHWRTEDLLRAPLHWWWEEQGLARVPVQPGRWLGKHNCPSLCSERGGERGARAKTGRCHLSCHVFGSPTSSKKINSPCRCVFQLCFAPFV